MVPDDWEEMSADEKVMWVSGNLSTGAHDVQGRISIPQGLREDGRGYVFENVQPRSNVYGGNVAVGRICFFDYSA